MSVVALIPAHNEAAGIGESVAPHVRDGRRVIVVADNCTDDTATLAGQAGAVVVETVGNADKAGLAIWRMVPRREA